MPLGSTLPFLRGQSSTAQTTAGTTQATAQPMIADHVSVPAAGNAQGVILPPANASDWFTAANEDTADSFFMYPPVGSSFNGKTVNEPLTMPPASAALFVFTSPTKIIAIFS